MEVMLVILGALVGSLIGLVVYDLRDRGEARKSLQKSNGELYEALTKIREVHNQLVLQCQTLEERVAALEFGYSGKKKT